mmetsp:Transcript_88830/g.250224  ORF Transcript_88830/g.250224 Transcript_88830/m.250224 type:complete len:86 (+) Transcript_88830:385-642(+)
MLDTAEAMEPPQGAVMVGGAMQLPPGGIVNELGGIGPGGSVSNDRIGCLSGELYSADPGGSVSDMECLSGSVGNISDKVESDSLR